MASSARIDEIKKKFDENPRRYFAPLANEFRKAGDLEQAILICEEFLPQQAGHMSGHIVYGQALFESGRLPESRTVFETALGLDPENLIALRHLGDIARAQGDPGEARRWYDRVLEADPRNEEIQGLLASLEGGAPAAPAAPASPAESPAAAAPQAASAEAATFEIAAIDLDLDDAGFAPPAPPAAPAPMGRPVTPPAAPAPDAPFDAISLEGFETPAPAPAPASSAPAPATASGRAEGLEPAEFEVPTTPHARAEGLEPAEFEAPTVHAPRAEGLETTEFTAPHTSSTDSSLLDLEGSFTSDMGAGASAAQVAPLPGLEETVGTRPPAVDEPPLPSLDLDQGLAVPETATAATPTVDVPLGIAAGPGAENPRMEPPAAMEAMPALELGEPIGEGESPDAAPAMMELPPAVIAAESVLMDAGGDYGEIDEPAAPTGAAQPPFVTETMAELYLKQGFHAQALDVYRQLAAAAPTDARLRERVATLERGAYPDEAETPAGPTVREFLLRLATRQPGQSAAAAQPPVSSDFASFDAIPETPIEPASHQAESASLPWEVSPSELAEEAPSDSTPLPFMDTSDDDDPPSAPPMDPPAPPVAEAAPPMPSPSERAAPAQGGAPSRPSGSIDALFGGRATGTSEDSAASALAQAFGGSTEAPPITGRPARAASAELSLDSVFRDGPPRPPRVSQSFSFDQFFSENAADAPATGEGGAGDAAPGEPAERSADDVKQFNSWLQGLKPQ